MKLRVDIKRVETALGRVVRCVVGSSVSKLLIMRLLVLAAILMYFCRAFTPLKSTKYSVNTKYTGRIDLQLPMSTTTNTEAGKIDLLFDSECPICMMEVEFLKKRDVDSRIRFTDLSSPDYNPADHGNVQFADGMRKIRAVLPGGEVVTGVEVFRQTYRAIGLGWIFDLTNVPLIGKAADALYDIWSENRLRITGRGDLADIVKERSEKLKSMEPPECDTDACEINYD